MNRLKQNRAASFASVALIYIFASALGILVYQRLPFAWWLSLLVADTVATLFTFLFSVLLRNASVYDPYWSVQPPVIVTAFAFGRSLSAFGALLLLAVWFWGLRLTLNWAYTFKNLCHQDWRYTMLKEKTGVFYPLINLVGIHMVPTLVVYGCILPAVHALRQGLEADGLGFVFLLVSLSAATLQGVADFQMHRFRRHPCGNFIRCGLWKYSRHPNYLGEILMWWGVALAVISEDPSAWYFVAGAVANTLLFFAVSIPMADKRQSRKEGFADYKKETRMLLPLKR